LKRRWEAVQAMHDECVSEAMNPSLDVLIAVTSGAKAPHNLSDELPAADFQISEGCLAALPYKDREGVKHFID
jgi:hypothetical protein